MLRKFLRGVLTAAVDAASPDAAAYEPVGIDRAPSDASLVESELRLMLERAGERMKELAAERDNQRRISQEYFAVIESIEKERNVWSEMWKDQAYSHVEAQSMLEKALKNARSVAAQAINLANKLRAEKGEPPLTPAILDAECAPPVGAAEAYKQRMDEAVAAVPPQIDGVAARDEIASRDPIRGGR